MRGLGEIIAQNARTANREPLAFTVYVVVDPQAVRDSVESTDMRSVEQIVADEIDSNLASLDYAERVVVRRKTI